MQSALSPTEEGILEAARQTFARVGFHGARMQEIADSAGINKAMLHYYFRSKEALFERVFHEAFADFLPKLHLMYAGSQSVMEKLDWYVGEHLQLLLKNPQLPIFILTEVHQDPERFFKIFLGNMPSPPPFMHFIQQMENEMEAGIIRRMDPRDLWFSVMGMVVFPFVARPMLQRVTATEEQHYQHLLENRKESIMRILRDTLTIDPKDRR